MTTKTLVTKIYIVLFTISTIQCNKSQGDYFFNQTFDQVLKFSVRDFRYNKVPGFEEYKKGNEPIYLKKKPDSLSKLKIKVSNLPIEFNFSEYSNKIPDEYKFVLGKKPQNIFDYIPRSMSNYSNDEYQANFVIRKKEHFKNLNSQSKDYGGFLELSKVIFNDSHNLAVMFTKTSRTFHDSQLALLFFKKVDGVWKISKTYGFPPY